ncbi:hypothetical protein MPER_12582 [Moniliophthora perniciosa FA553]|nr:hypothetical protein MPER_12582 [Moniliophthora perniciosa FA553]
MTLAHTWGVFNPLQHDSEVEGFCLLQAPRTTDGCTVEKFIVACVGTNHRLHRFSKQDCDHHIKKQKRTDSNFTEPPPDIIDGEEEFEIEAIVGLRPKKGTPKSFKVSWTGYDPSYDIWLSAEALEHADEKFQGYLKRHKLKV